MRPKAVGLTATLMCILGGPTARGQVPFLRGDVNDDGRMSIADAHYLTLWLQGGGPPPPCVKAADVNDDGKVWLSGAPGDDAQAIFFSISCGDVENAEGCDAHSSVAEPREAPGEDPTPDDLTCISYMGTAPPASDSKARLEIVDARAAGGQSALAVVKIRRSHSRPIGAYWGAFDGLGIIAAALGIEHDMVRDGKVFFANLAYAPELTWPPATEQMGMKVYLRLEPGTPAGEYPLVFIEAEMADGLTGQAIFPAVTDGLLRVHQDVAFDAAVESTGSWQCHIPKEELPPLGPEDVRAAFSLALVPGEKGARVKVPFWIEANVPVEGFTFAFNYGNPDFNGLVRLERIVPVERGGRPWDVFEHQVSAERPRSWGRAIFKRGDAAASLPPGERHHVLDLEFQVDAAAPDGHVRVYPSNFMEVAEGDSTVEWPSAVLAYGRFLDRRMVTCFEMMSLDWGILLGGNTTRFLRGDATADGAISLADAVWIGHAKQLDCEDAADANDDGSANFTDSVHLIRHLFDPAAPATDLPAPFPQPGRDETLDPVLCDRYGAAPAPRTDDLLRLGSIEVVPGETAEVPVYATASQRLQGYQLVVRYDPEVFTPAETSARHDGTVFAAVKLHYDVAPRVISPGYVALGFAGDLFRPSAAPAGSHLLVGKLTGLVSAAVQPGDELVLEPVPFAAGEPAAPDRLRAELIELERDGRVVALLPALEAGVLRVVDGSEATFIRGDSNLDLEVNISDAVFTLGYLYLGGAAPACEDAADADDSGSLELTDAVFTLTYLFNAAGKLLPPPHPGRGRDGEEDELAPCREAGG